MIFVDLPNGVQVAVSEDIKQMTSYVLQEQGDWFEDEIKFLRKVVKPGWRCIDIGANHGVYALTLAKFAGRSGKVWAIEPDPAPLGMLRESVKRNKFKNVSLVEVGLSNSNGSTLLFSDGNSETNSLTSAVGRATHRPVKVQTLDFCARRHEMTDIDFVKLDAEGEELRILEKGKKFFAREDPLVMFEFNAENNALVGAFYALGYGTYRLLPGLGMLAPFNAHRDMVDMYQLNLFACKQARAAKLEKRGFLAQQPATNPHTHTRWRTYLEGFAYAGPNAFGGRWTQWWKTAPHGADWDVYEQALIHYANAHTAKSPRARLKHLRDALSELATLPSMAPLNMARLMTTARVSWELGLRKAAVELLMAMVKLYQSGVPVVPEEPFLPPCPRFDQIDPDLCFEHWCLSAVVEQLETLHSFSSYFDAQPSIASLESLERLGFQSDQMKSRLDVVRRRMAT